MKLVIAEKPSVAMALAAVLGANEKKDGYLEGGGYLVSWCVGHLLELAQPEAYGEQYARWRYGDLPILPDEWKYEVPKDKKKQLDLLCRLMKDKRVDSVVCATDAGREGELIFRLVYEYAGCRKPMERLWISSMEDAAIRDGFEHLRPGKDYDRLYDAAVCRAGADWLVGINATRLFSVLYGVTLNVGRVMSPTLALLVQREAEIQGFTSRPFYVPEITCGGFTASGDKLTEKQAAEAVRRECDRQTASVLSVEKQTKNVQPPRLYDLTTLQRECNRIYGYTAQQTLDYLQSLYEKKLATYPRTDSQYLTEDNGLCVQGKRFDFLLGMDGTCPEVLPGEVYVPICYRDRYGLAAGSTMTIEGQTLTVAGFIRDAQMNSMMASSKRFLVSAADYALLRDQGEEEYLIEFLLRDGVDMNVFQTAYTASGLPANGPTITRPLVRMMNALSDGTMIFVIFLMSIIITITPDGAVRLTFLDDEMKGKDE